MIGLSLVEFESSASSISMTNLVTWGPIRMARVLPVIMAICLVLLFGILG